MQPFISVVIPTYNSENFVTTTLETLYSQTYKNYEVIVSDDGSTDDTVGVSTKVRSDDVKLQMLITEKIVTHLDQVRIL